MPFKHFFCSYMINRIYTRILKSDLVNSCFKTCDYTGNKIMLICSSVTEIVMFFSHVKGIGVRNVVSSERKHILMPLHIGLLYCNNEIVIFFHVKWYITLM